MPTLPNMSLITPTLGGDSGTWDDKINAAFALVDAHDHTAGKGVAVPVSGLNINADLAMGGYAVSGIGSLAFNAVAALGAGARRLFVSSADNELYWRTNAGTNVKLTNGTSINTSLLGGIVGDYASVSAEVAYSDADDTYTFKQQGTKPWARIASGPVRIHEFNTTETVYVEHAVDAALAASYTVTWPAAAPAAATVVMMSPTGVISVPQTNATLPGGCNVVLSGVGDYKHGDKQLYVPVSSMFATAGSVSASLTSIGTDAYGRQISTSSTVLMYLPMLREGWRIKSITVVASSTAFTGSSILTQDHAAGTLHTSASSVATTPSGGPALVMTLSAAYTVSGNTNMYVSLSTGGTAIIVSGLIVTYDIP